MRFRKGALSGTVGSREKARGDKRIPAGGGQQHGGKDDDIALDSSAIGDRNSKGNLIACYDVILDDNGYLTDYKRISESDTAVGTKWYAYCKISSDSPWYNNQSYANTLDKKTIERFVEVTHERYKEVVGDEFDGVVPAIFTDEPQFTKKGMLMNSTDQHDIMMPWTDDIPETYLKAYGDDLLDSLPELFWDLPESAPSVTRYRYHDHITERFAEAFVDVCGDWCSKNNIALTGHLMNEPTLHSQTSSVGDAMRSYRGFELPGIDMLCNNFEFTTAKQTQSAVHQYGREGMLSELYGVTGWDSDFRDYKLHGDWQACLGVTIRVPHLSWYAMGGEAKRDYPACIHYQSPWYKEFACIEDHFSRVHTAMTRGKPVVRVGVIHPVESFWLHWGPNDKTALIRNCLDKNFQDLTKWLIKGSIDFDFICEALIPSLCKNPSNPLRVGEMEYDVVLVPGCETLRSTTLDALEAFSASGGKLIFLGNAPTLVDAKTSDRAAALYNGSKTIPYDRNSVLSELDGERELTIRLANGELSDEFIHQLRQDNDCRWLFVTRCAEPYDKSLLHSSDLNITVNGEYTPFVYDTMNGDIYPIDCKYVHGKTVVSKKLFDYDSLLLKLVPGKRELPVESRNTTAYDSVTEVPSLVPYTLSERNALLLDTAEYKLDDGEFMPEEEILRLDNACRNILGIRGRDHHVPQPWVIKEEATTHSITLRFTINSLIDYKGAELALEDAEKAVITFNGENVRNDITGWFTDKDIKTVSLPDIVRGENILVITLPFGVRTNTEWCYILGNFGVNVAGSVKTICDLPEKIAFDSILHQGLPFYSGNITYHLESEGKNISVSTNRLIGTLVTVTVDGEKKGRIAFPPYNLEINGLTKGKHKVDITLFGNRANAFGPVHNTNENNSHHGPNSWRTDGSHWSYEYVLRKIGLLTKPEIRYN